MAAKRVLKTAARQKNKMNHGNWIFVLSPFFVSPRIFDSLFTGDSLGIVDAPSILDLLRLIAAVASASGTIQSARANFTVVPMTRACEPYLAAAPTTELVS